MKQKLVSIIIPVYNGEKYIAQCLQSVREQSYNDFEVIIINDASPDNSQNIINKFVTDDDRFKVYVNEINCGGYVRHKGIDLACGEFLLFLDQDDWLTPRAVEILIKKISIENADVAYGALRKVFSPNTFIGKNISNNCDKKIK